jgi:4'-phosphopantetheinyl transferase
VGKEKISIQNPSVCIKETLSGKRGIVDLWYYFHKSIDDSALLAAHESLMTPEECARYRSFYSEHDRKLFLATRALVRVVLSRYAEVAPGEWRFAAGRYGKPYIAHPTVTPPIYFNLSNTDGLAVCAVSTAHESIGIDVERMDREIEILELADRYFSQPEAQALRALPASERQRHFVSIWTLKESYIKARGLGLSQTLNQFSFLLEHEKISVTFGPGMSEDAARWRFGLLEFPPNYMVAVGADTGTAPMMLCTAEIVPLQERLTAT